MEPKNKFPLSIIIVNYNNAIGLEKTLSFLKNEVSQFIIDNSIELVIIDGSSTDNSREIIDIYSDIINFSVSEPDFGIYDAMNKGIYYSQGEYCYFLNTNDAFNSHLLDSIIETINTDSFKLLVFPVNRFNSDGKYIAKKVKTSLEPNDFIDSMPVCHQGVIFKKTHILYYDSSYKIIADKDLIYRYIKQYNSSIKYFSEVLMDYYEDGYSIKNIKQWKFENIVFCLKNSPSKIKLLHYIISYFKSKIL